MNEAPPETQDADGAQPPPEIRQEDKRGFKYRMRQLFFPSTIDGEAPGIDRRQAALDGFQAVFLRITLAVAILTGSVFFAIESLSIRKFLPQWDFLPEGELPDLLRLGLCPVAWLAAAGCTLVIMVSDDDRKWRQLNWAVCVLLASGSLIPSTPWIGPVAVAAGLFGLHYAIHLGLKIHDQSMVEELEREKLEREETKEQEPPAARPKLLECYRGVAGFEEERPDGKKV